MSGITNVENLYTYFDKYKFKGIKGQNSIAFKEKNLIKELKIKTILIKKKEKIQYS